MLFWMDIFFIIIAQNGSVYELLFDHGAILVS